MASNNERDLTIVLKGDASGLTGTVNSATTQMKGLEAQLDATGAAAERSGAKLSEASKTAAAAAQATTVAQTENAASAVAQAAAQTSAAAAAEKVGVKVTQASTAVVAATKATTVAQTASAAAAVAQATAQNSAAAATKLMGVSLNNVNSTLLRTVPGMSRLASAAGGVFTALGGWATVALAAAAAIYYLSTIQTEAEKAVTKLTDATDKMSDAHGKAKLAAIAEASALIEVTRQRQAAYEAQMKALNVAQQSVGGALQMDNLASAARNAARNFQTLGTAIDAASEKLHAAQWQGAIEKMNADLAAISTSQLNDFESLRKSLQSQAQTMQEQVATFGKGRAAQLAYAESIEIAKIAAQGDTNETKARIKSLQDTYAPLIASAAQLDKLTAAKKADSAASRDALKAERERQRDLEQAAGAYLRLADIQDKLSGKTDAVSKAWADSAAALRDVAAQGAVLIKTGTDEATVQALVAKAVDEATAARNRSLDAAKRQMDVSGRLIEQMQQEANLAVLNPRDQAVARAAQEYELAYRQQNLQLTQQQKDADKARVEAVAASSFDMKKMADEQNAIAQEYSGYWENAAGSVSKAFGDLITRQTKGWKDFGRSLKSIAQQFVSDLISQFLRLRVLGPLLSGAMGAAAGWLGIAGSLGGSSLTQSAAYFGNSSTIGETAGSVGGSAGGSGSYASMLSSVSSAKNLYTGLFGPSSSAAQGSLYTNPATGLTVNMPGVTPQPYGGMIGNTGLSYAGAAGGLAGAYWGLGRGSGGISTAASTATGAIGGYYAGTAIATTMTAGISAGLAAIPVVGWVALAAMAIDQVSGGKLFGTKYQTAASDATLSIGANGGSAAASLYQTKQGALFSGRKTRVVDQAVSPEMQAAADALYDGVEKTMVQGALKLGVDVPAMINASLQTHTTYNDKGQVRATEYIVNYLGQTWKEATAEAASQRIGAEALVATVAASAGAVAQTIAQQWRSSAETLLDGAQMMLAAQADIKRGTSLVALGASASLAQVVQFTQTMQAEGEKLADTYARLAQASAAYLQFVGQFEPVNNTFGGALQAIAKQMQANIDQANALAQAAGLQGARESDLANIHQVAAQQAADAIAQLSSAAQDIAAKLYGVTNGSLSAVQAQLASMQSKVQQAAQLAIGDNSPLSTKEKLDVALQGLRSGITSADDVLSLGRKLYSSSADYTGLYNKVQDILGLGSATGTGAGSLSDQMGQYNSLFQQQQQLQAQADAMTRFTDAKTLAQYVADISTTHGIGYGEAASGLGFNLSDLAKDLGVSNLAGYLDNLKLADIPGATMNASASVVDAIQQLGRDLIQTLTGGPITAAAMTGTTSVKATPNDPQVIALLDSINQRLTAIEGHSSTTADTNTQMVKQGVSNDLRTISGTTRNLSSNV